MNVPNEIDELREKNRILIEENVKLTEQLKEKNEQLKEKNEQLKEKNEQLKEKNERYKIVFSSWKKLHNDQQSIISSLVSENKHLNAEQKMEVDALVENFYTTCSIQQHFHLHHSNNHSSFRLAKEPSLMSDVKRNLLLDYKDEEIHLLYDDHDTSIQIDIPT
eukprot:Awhi_evm1s6994